MVVGIGVTSRISYDVTALQSLRRTEYNAVASRRRAPGEILDGIGPSGCRLHRSVTYRRGRSTIDWQSAYSMACS